MSSTILPECPNCSTFSKTVKLSKGEGVLECCHCGYFKNFKEMNGAVLNQGHEESDLSPNSFLWMQNYTELPEESLKVFIQDYFSEKPYDGAKKIAKYRLIFDWKMEIYYD